MIAAANFYAAWISIMLGLLSGTVQGLFFHDEDWLGGYASWKRRMLRLGHVSFFGVAFLNLAFVMSASYLKLADKDTALTSWLSLLALVAMPLVCYLSAFRKDFRHLFFIPVASLIVGLGYFSCEVFFR